MWHLIPAILYLTNVQAHHYRQPGNLYPSAIINNDPTIGSPYYYPAQALVQEPYNVQVRATPGYLPYTQQRPYNADPYYNGQQLYNTPQLYNRLQFNQGAQVGEYLQDADNLRQPKSKGSLSEVLSFDYATGNDVDTDVATKSSSDGESYFDELELVDKFGYYLKKRTQLDAPSLALNDATQQYNALLAVLMALARVVRNSCADFDQVYDEIYQTTVETYYRYGLANADKIPALVEDYIKKGNSHIPKIRKLKQELCEKDLYCSINLDNKIKSSALLYVKELEALEALTRLAKHYYPYMEEFNEAAEKGAMFPYLQNSKERLKDYVMHIVNSVEHLTDKPVMCTK